MDLAVRNGVPFISLIDSGGARIQEGVRSMGGYAEIFRRNAQYSGVVPQVSVMLGPCAGGAAYSPALTDMVIMVEKSSFMFLTGPDVIKAVTGEVIDSESLGGASVHTSVSGVAHVSVHSEKAALEMARHFLSYLPSNNVENPPYVQPTDSLSRMDEDLNHMIPLEATEPYVMHQVIEKIIDTDSFLEIQPDWARNAIVGLARIGGHSVGIVGQEPAIMAGVIDIDAADKMTRFVRLLQHSARHICGFARLPAWHCTGTRRHHSSWRKTFICVFRSHRAEDLRHYAQSLWRRVCRHVQQVSRNRCHLRVAVR
jgi:propionyl-CoA carboxylase beta chain